MSIKVLQVVAIMNRGGAETMLMNLYRRIDRKKIQFDFVSNSLEKGIYDEEIKELGGTVFNCPHFNGKNLKEYVTWWKRFYAIHGHLYSIIHGHIYTTASIYLFLAPKKNTILIAHSHNSSNGLGLFAIYKRILEYPLRYIADYYFACSLNAGNWLFGKKITAGNKFFILKNAIDIEQFCYNKSIQDNIKKQLNIESTFIVGHVGRFEKQKNHERIISIFEKIKKDEEKSCLVLIGDGSLRNKIEELVEKRLLTDSVLFLGIREDIQVLLQVFDVFLMPSKREGLPVTIIEAQAAGVPCVLSDVITPEVKFNNNVEFLSLKESNEKWSQKILIHRKKCKINATENLIDGGYSIGSSTAWLEAFYINSICDSNKQK